MAMREQGECVFIFQDPENYLEYREGYVVETLKTRYRVECPELGLTLTFDKNGQCSNAPFWHICDDTQQVRQFIEDYRRQESELLCLIRHSEEIRDEIVQIARNNLSISGFARIRTDDDGDAEVQGDEFYLS